MAGADRKDGVLTPLMSNHSGYAVENGRQMATRYEPDLPKRAVAQAYEKSHEGSRSRKRALNIILVSMDCMLIGMQPILVHMSKVDGKFLYSPVSVNFVTEVTKCVFAVLMLVYQSSRPTANEHSLVSLGAMWRASRKNFLLAVPAALYAINNYLKFVLQLYFKPATVKMLGNLKVFTIALLLKAIMKRKFTVLQWEALCLLIIGITVNQLSCTQNSVSDSIPLGSLSFVAYLYTFMSVTIPSTASVYNEFALKKNFDSSVHLQNLLMYAFGAFFNLIGLATVTLLKGNASFSGIFTGHSTTTMLLVANNALQGILSSFFFKFADTILKKYSSTIATIFTGIMSSFLFGHQLTLHFLIGVAIVCISMHQFFSSAQQSKMSESNARLYSQPSSGNLLFVRENARHAGKEKDEGLGFASSHLDREQLLPR
eukprot:jgi/Mesvir1/24763/Mv22019-RA.1